MLYDEIESILKEYQSAVISLVTEDGYPISLRCQPIVHKTEEFLEIQLPTNLAICEGLASLLCHSHNEELFDLKSVSMEGNLEKAGAVWRFRLTKMTQVMGRNKFLEFIQDVIIKPRRNAKKYLEKAKLARPQIPWAQLKAFAEEGEK